MKKYILGLMSVVAMLGMASCSEEELTKSTPVQGGDLIVFGIDQKATRTVYSSEDAWQIQWENNDAISIFCNQAEGLKNADYTITPTNEAHTQTSSVPSQYGKVNPNDNGLRWNGAIKNEDPAHNFYAVYPAGAAEKKDAEGVFDFSLPTNQVCTISGELSDASEVQYVAAPDMKKAIMVAKAEGIKAGDITGDNKINLTFSPIMTTLDIIVTNGISDSNEDFKDLDVTGIAITLPKVPRVAGNKFRYNIHEGAIEGFDNNNSTETFFVGLNRKIVEEDVATGEQKERTENQISLKKGQSIKFTAFLPPVQIDGATATDANAIAKNIKISVQATGAVDYVATVSSAIKPSSKRKIELPAISISSQNQSAASNNWISRLDDNIYINQLSIPGTNNSAAFASFGNLATSQSKNLEEQWKSGVRAFEFRTAVGTPFLSSHGGGEVGCYDAGTNLQQTLDEAMTSLTNLLKSNPNEFAIVIISYQGQNGASGISPSDLAKLGKNEWKTTNGFMYNGIPYYINNWANKKNANNQSWFVDFKPDMTIAEARGRIILINYDEYNGYKGALVADAESVQDNGTDSDFSSEGGWHKVTYSTGSTDELIWIQNMFGSRYPDNESKQAGIKAADAIAVTLHTSTDHKWVINYVGGASSSSLANTTSYRNAAAANNKFYNDWLINPARPEGSTGIVMVSHQGVDMVGTTNVYGANLPQTIINNNFRFRMQRANDLTDQNQTGKN